VPLPRLEIPQGRDTPQVKDILAHPTVPSTRPLSSRHMGQLMLHLDSLSQPLSPSRRLRQLAQSLLARLVLSDCNCPSLAWLGRRASRSQRASVAFLRFEFDCLSGLEPHRLPGRAGNRLSSHVQLESRLREELPVPRYPRLAEHLAQCPLGKAGSVAPRQPSTLRTRKSKTVSSTMEASEASG